MSAAAAAIGVSRPHLLATLHAGPRRSRGRPPHPDGDLVATIGKLIADLPTYGYRQVHAPLRWQADAAGRAAPNPKRVDRVMKLHGLRLQRAGTRNEQRRHDGPVAVDVRNIRLCSDYKYIKVLLRKTLVSLASIR